MKCQAAPWLRCGRTISTTRIEPGASCGSVDRHRDWSAKHLEELLLLALLAIRILRWLRFTFGLTRFERYYLPHYLRAKVEGRSHATAK